MQERYVGDENNLYFNKIKMRTIKTVHIKPIMNENMWVTTRPIRFKVYDFEIKIEKWFKFDWCSVPKIFCVIWTKTEPKTILACCTHDWLLDNWYPRHFADKIFRVMMILVWTPSWKATLYYYSVRIYGILKNLFFKITWYAKKKK